MQYLNSGHQIHMKTAPNTPAPKPLLTSVMDEPLLPTPIITRWETAQFYSKNWNDVEQGCPTGGPGGAGGSALR